MINKKSIWKDIRKKKFFKGSKFKNKKIKLKWFVDFNCYRKATYKEKIV